MASVRSTPIGAIVDNVTALGAATTNDGPGGLLGHDEIQSNSAGTVTVELISTLSAVPVNDSRIIRLVANGMLTCTGPHNLQVRIDEDGTAIVRRNFYIGGSSRFAAFHVEILSHSPSVGTHDYELWSGISGTGETATFTADVNTTATFTAEDIGPDF